jgi:phosphoribosylglycinamide formyltransferase 1
MSDKLRMGFCVSGQGRLFRAAAMQAAELGIEPALVVVEEKASPTVESFCQERGIPFQRLPKMPRPQFDEALMKACTGTDLGLLSLTFDKTIPAQLVHHYAGRVINVHPALLPAFKGMNGLEQVSSAGVRFAGATLHEVDEEMDHGAVIAQCVIGIRQNEPGASIGRRIYPLMRLMYLQVIAWYAEGRITKDAQGRIWVKDAVYGELPISPAIERSFPD